MSTAHTSVCSPPLPPFRVAPFRVHAFARPDRDTSAVPAPSGPRLFTSKPLPPVAAYFVHPNPETLKINCTKIKRGGGALGGAGTHLRHAEALLEHDVAACGDTRGV